MSNFISGTISAVNSSIKYDDYVFAVQVNGATKLRNAQTQGTTIISGSLATNIASSGGEMIALTSNQAQKGFLAGQAVGFVRAAINKCYQNASGKAVIVFNDNKISDFVCSETYSTVQAVLATSIFGGGSSTPTQTAATTSAAGVGGKTANPPQDGQNKFFKGDATWGVALPYWDNTTNWEIGDVVLDPATNKIYRVTTAHVGGVFTVGNFAELSPSSSSGSSLTEYGVAVSGGSGGITARFYGTSGITVTRAAADTYQFNVPASGFLQSGELYLPIADNAVAGFTLKFVYASPTFNTNFQTMKPCVIQMLTDTGSMYANRAAPAATDFANTPTIPTSGTLQQVITVPSAIQGVVLKIVFKF